MALTCVKPEMDSQMVTTELIWQFVAAKLGMHGGTEVLNIYVSGASMVEFHAVIEAMTCLLEFST